MQNSNGHYTEYQLRNNVSCGHYICYRNYTLIVVKNNLKFSEAV